VGIHKLEAEGGGGHGEYETYVKEEVHGKEEVHDDKVDGVAVHDEVDGVAVHDDEVDDAERISSHHHFLVVLICIYTRPCICGPHWRTRMNCPGNLL
jgi:hypothetical protein